MTRFSETARTLAKIKNYWFFKFFLHNHIKDAKRSITAIARRHAAKIVAALLSRHVSECDSIIDEFETIKAKAEKEPDDTEELIQIQNYILSIKLGLIRLGLYKCSFVKILTFYIKITKYITLKVTLSSNFRYQ